MYGEASKVLDKDIDEIIELYILSPTPAVTRALVRAYAAYIEASLYDMRQETLKRARKSSSTLSLEEENVLLEKNFFLDKKGRLQSKDEHQKFLPLVLFSIKTYAKSHGINFEPNTGDHSWEAFQYFVKFRNRLTHPKSLQDIEFSKNDLEKMMTALQWFHNTNGALLDEINKGLSLVPIVPDGNAYCKLHPKLHPCE